MLWQQNKPQPIPVVMPSQNNQNGFTNHWSQAVPMGMAPPGYPMSAASNLNSETEQRDPEMVDSSHINVEFKDTASVNASSYLKETPKNVSEAVSNTVLLKFPSDPKRYRSSVRKRNRSKVGLL